MKIKDIIKKSFIFKEFSFYRLGKKMLRDQHYANDYKRGEFENQKFPMRKDVINFVISKFDRPVTYLEIGVRYPEVNFNHIQATTKYSVDPGYENDQNPADFKLTSDEFFKQLSEGKLLDQKIKFDIIFIDGLHLAEQVERDIENAFSFLAEDGVIVMHDCNPPTEWHARHNFHYTYTPAKGRWNGTTWKAFYKWRCKEGIQSCCVDTDYGVGLLSKEWPFGEPNATNENPFYEYHQLDKNREKHLNIISFEELKTRLL